jgi:chaperone BCS1
MTTSSTYTSVLQDLIFKNDVFLATITLFLFGTVITAVYRFVWRIYYSITSGLMTSVSFTNQERDLHRKFLRWVSEKSTTISTSGFQLASNKIKKGRHSKENIFENDGKKKNVELLPGEGDRLFWYKGYLMWMTRVVSPTPLSVGGQELFLFETIYVSTYGGSKKIFEELFNEIQATSVQDNSGRLNIYTCTDYGVWALAKKGNLRAMESVFVQNDLANTLLNDVTKFLNTRHYYASKGVPYRRGYLLYGPPGCGKSSTIAAIASQLNLSIYFLTLTSRDMSDEQLNSLLRDIPSRAIVLIEDIDSVFNMRNTLAKKSSSLTFSGLLNAIDGVASQDGRILFMTTNHLELLDPALMRPGRIDTKVYFARANKQQMSQMFNSFYDYEKKQKKEQAVNILLENIPEEAVSTAVLQGHFLKYADNCRMAAKNWEEIITSQTLAAKDEFVPTIDVNVRYPTAVITRIGDTITNWLVRLGMSTVVSKFLSLKIYHLTEIAQEFGAKDFRDDYQVNIAQANRLETMMKGKKEALEGFEIAPQNQAENLFKQKFETAKEDVVDKFVHSLDNHPVSVFQITDYLNDVSDEQSALKNISQLIDPPIEKKTIFDESVLIKDWVLSTDCKCSLPKDIRTRIADSFTNEMFTTLKELVSIEDDVIEEVCEWANKVQMSQFLYAVKKLKERRDRDKGDEDE